MSACNCGSRDGHLTWCDSLHGLKTTKQTKHEEDEKASRTPKKITSDRDGGSKWGWGKR